MKKIVWQGSITLTAIAALPEDATQQEVAEELAAQFDEKLNLCSPAVFWEDIQDIEAIGVIE